MLYVVSISFDFESKKIYKIFWFVYLTIVFLISVLPIDYYYKDNIINYTDQNNSTYSIKVNSMNDLMRYIFQQLR